VCLHNYQFTSDYFNGGPGNDLITANDGEIDLVNGSSGLADSAQADSGVDLVSNVENVI